MRPNAEMSSGQATFDLKAAREKCDSIKGQNPGDGNCITHAFYKAAWDLLPAALDEVERLEAAHLKAQNSNLLRKQAYESLEKIASEQAKRIAELEADKAFWQKRSQTLREVCNAAELQDNKSRAALKKLGQVKRERGKALVEERARFNVVMKVVPLNTSFPNSDHKKAREQLRREGKL